MVVVSCARCKKTVRGPDSSEGGSDGISSFFPASQYYGTDMVNNFLPITFIFNDIFLVKFIFHINNIGKIESDFTLILTRIVRSAQTSGKYGQRECGAPECPKQKSGNTKSRHVSKCWTLL